MAKSTKNNNHEEWTELKRLLLEEESARIGTLEAKYLEPEDLARSVGEVLPDVVDNVPNKKRLSKKFYPIVEDSLYRSVQKNPESLADAIYPVIAPAIRKSINEALKKVTESVNSSVNSGLSAKNLKWRLQALFSNHSYGELVLKNSLLFQVQELYLIHNETGLLISHLSQKTGDNPDGDMISGMLTAIRDFVSDSFKVEKGETLETIQVGDLVVLIEQGPHASLACVVKGDPTTEFRQTLNTTVEKIHQDFGAELHRFDGDTSTLKDTEDLMQSALVTKLEDDEKGKSEKLGFFILTAGIIILLLLSYSIYWGVYWNGIVKQINQESAYEVIIKKRRWHNLDIVSTESADLQLKRLRKLSYPLVNGDSERSISKVAFSKRDSFLIRQFSLNLEDFIDFKLRKGKLVLQKDSANLEEFIDYMLRKEKLVYQKDTAKFLAARDSIEEYINRHSLSNYQKFWYYFRKRRLNSIVLVSQSINSAVQNAKDLLVREIKPEFIETDSISIIRKNSNELYINSKGDTVFIQETRTALTGRDTQRLDSIAMQVFKSPHHDSIDLGNLDNDPNNGK